MRDCEYVVIMSCCSHHSTTYKKIHELNTKYIWTNVEHRFQNVLFQSVEGEGEGERGSCVFDCTLTEVIQKLVIIIRLLNGLCNHPSFAILEHYIFDRDEAQVSINDIKWAIFYDDIIHNLNTRSNCAINYLLAKQKSIQVDEYVDCVNWMLEQRRINLFCRPYKNLQTIHILQDDENNLWFDVNDLAVVLQAVNTIRRDLILLYDYYRQFEFQRIFNHILIDEFSLYQLLMMYHQPGGGGGEEFINFIYTQVIPETKTNLQKQHCLICLKQLNVYNISIYKDVALQSLQPNLDWSIFMQNQNIYIKDVIVDTTCNCYNSERCNDFDVIMSNIANAIINIHWIFTTNRFYTFIQLLQNKLHNHLFSAILYDDITANLAKRSNCALNFLIQQFNENDSILLHFGNLKKNIENLPKYSYVDCYLNTGDFGDAAKEEMPYLDILFFHYMLKEPRSYCSPILYDKLLEYYNKHVKLYVMYSDRFRDDSFEHFAKLYRKIYYNYAMDQIVDFIVMLKSKVSIIETWWIEQMYKPTSTYVKKTLKTNFYKKIKTF